MSMFTCARCDELRDSDDGCEEYKRTQLICIACMEDLETEEVIDRQLVGMSYDGIKAKLLSMGCPADLAEELAREKSR